MYKLMRKIALCLLLPGFATAGLAQTPDSLLKGKHYNAIAANERVQEMSATGDSIIVSFKKDSVITGKDFYRIISVQPRGDYAVVIVKMDPSSLTLVSPKGRRSLSVSFFGVFVFHFEIEGSRLLVLHDGRLWLTASEAANTYAAIRLSGEYFNIWYEKERFDRFVHYPSLNDADSTTVQKVALDWIKKIMEHRGKKFNTYNTDRAGADYARDNFTKVLVNNHLSPLATPGDFNKKLKQYHLNLIPERQLPLTDSTSRHQNHNIPKTISD
jgi:hypothetical protein